MAVLKERVTAAAIGANLSSLRQSLTLVHYHFDRCRRRHRSGGFGFEVGLVGLILVGFAVVYWIVRRIYGQEWVRQLVTRINTISSQVKLRFALFIFLIFVVLSEFLGAEIVLGTFRQAYWSRLLPVRKIRRPSIRSNDWLRFLHSDLFIMIGVRLDLQALIDSPDALLLVPALILGSLAVKIIPGLLLRLKFSWHDTFAGGMLLTARLSLIVAEAAIGVELGILTEPVNADIILLAMIMATAGPLVFNYMMPKTGNGRRAADSGHWREQNGAGSGAAVAASS